MSEGIVIALISAASAFICAGIAAFGGIVVESLKNSKGLSVGMLGLLGFIGAGIGLLGGALFGTMLMRQTQVSSLPVTQQTQPIVSPTQRPSITTGVVWQDLGVFYAPEGTLLGNADTWIVFQVWDGQNSATVVHGLIEPGWFIKIPSAIQGTTWSVSAANRDDFVSRVLQAREEVVQRVR